MNGPTVLDIRSWPATVSPETAATAFGISRSYAYELVRRGEFPAKVISVGSRSRVITASILRALDIAPTPAPDNGKGGPAQDRPATASVHHHLKDTDVPDATHSAHRSLL